MRRNRFCGSVSWARSRSSITGRYEWYSTMHLALTCEDDELMNIVEELYFKAFQGTKHETDVMRIDSLQELQLSSKNSPILPGHGHDLQPIGFKSNRWKNKRPGRRGTPQCAFCQKYNAESPHLAFASHIVQEFTVSRAERKATMLNNAVIELSAPVVQKKLSMPLKMLSLVTHPHPQLLWTLLALRIVV